MRYQKVTDAYTTHTVRGPDGDIGECITELCELDGWTYISVPDGCVPVVPEAITTLETVALDDALRERIKAASPHCRLIYERMQQRIRDAYPLDEELYLARIAVGALNGTYALEPGEADAIAAYQAHVESVRAWGRGERAALGL